MNKTELIAILVDGYGYNREDLKDKNGKLLTNAKLEALIKAEKDDAEQLKVETPKVNETDFSLSRETVSNERERIDEDDLIFVFSGSEEKVIYNSKRSGRVWEFHEFGQEDAIPYGELRIMNNQHPTYFKDGLLIVLNEQVQKDFGLVDKYKNILTPDNIEEIFDKSPKELGEFIDKLPQGMKKTLVDRAMKLYKEDRITNTLTIRVIEEKFGFSLDDNTPHSDLVLKGEADNNNNIIYVDKR